MLLAIKTLIIVTIVANINLVVKYTAELNENKREQNWTPMKLKNREKHKTPYQKYFKWLFFAENANLSPGSKSRFGSSVKPAPCRIPCPVCDTSSMAPPNGLVTTPIRPFPTPVMTPLAASLTSLACRIPWMGWSTIPATAPRRLRPNPPSPFDNPAKDKS